MLFADDMMFVEETIDEVNKKLKEWRAVLEGKKSYN